MSKKKNKAVKPEVKKAVEPKATVNVVEQKRNALIEEIRPKLLSKSQLKAGGSHIRTIHLRESGFQPAIQEINQLGAKLGIRPIGLGNLRRN